MNSTLQNDLPVKLYSEKAIGIATFIGGPLAAGFLMRRNFINLGNEAYGKHALFAGVLFTIFIFAVLFSLPDYIADKIPNFLLPAIYTAIVFFMVEKFQGKALKEHKASEGMFYSGWKAAGIGTIGLVFMGVFIFAYAFSIEDDFNAGLYEKGLSDFERNETLALKLFAMSENSSEDDIRVFLRNKAIPAWQNNIGIIHSLDSMEGISDELVERNKLLLKYCELRLDSYKLIYNSILDNSLMVEEKLTDINQQLEAVMQKLN